MPTTTLRLNPEVQALESRLTPSLYVGEDGNLHIEVTDFDHDDYTFVRYQHEGDTDHIEVFHEGEYHIFFAPGEIPGGIIYYEGGPHWDTFTNYTHLRTIAQGGYGDDQLTGGSGDDVLDGGFDHDAIFGGAGNDTLRAGGDDAPNDLHGGPGDDTLRGWVGQDWLFGDEGSDYLRAGSGDDFLFGGEGQDFLEGGFGNDRLHGGRGDVDFLTGGPDADGFYRDWAYGPDGWYNRDFYISDFDESEGDHFFEDFNPGDLARRAFKPESVEGLLNLVGISEAPGLMGDTRAQGIADAVLRRDHLFLGEGLFTDALLMDRVEPETMPGSDAPPEPGTPGDMQFIEE